MPEKKLAEAQIRERIVQAFDIARAEGMLHSKDGKHSLSSVSDAEDVIELVSDFYRQEGRREVVELIKGQAISVKRDASEYCKAHKSLKFRDNQAKNWHDGYDKALQHLINYIQLLQSKWFPAEKKSEEKKEKRR